MGPALLPVGEELRQGRIVHQVQHIVLRRDVAVGDARGVIDAGIGADGRGVDDQPAFLHDFARQVVIGVIAFRCVARNQREGNVAFGEGVLHGLRSASRAENQSRRRLFAAQQFVQRGPQADDVGVVAREASVRRTADAVDGPNGLRLGRHGIQKSHHLAFVGNRDVQSAKLGQTLQQSGQLPDRGQFVEGVFAIAQSLPGKFFREVGRRGRMAQRTADQSETPHGLFLLFFDDHAGNELDAVNDQKSHDAEQNGLHEQRGLPRELFESSGGDVVLHERLRDAVTVEIGLHGLLPRPHLVERPDHETHQHGHRNVVPMFEQPRQQVREGDDARRGSDDEDHDDGNVQIAHGLHDILVFAQQQQNEGPGDAGQDHGADGDGARKHHEPPVVGGFCGRGDGDPPGRSGPCDEREEAPPVPASDLPGDEQRRGDDQPEEERPDGDGVVTDKREVFIDE